MKLPNEKLKRGQGKIKESCKGIEELIYVVDNKHCLQHFKQCMEPLDKAAARSCEQLA